MENLTILPIKSSHLCAQLAGPDELDLTILPIKSSHLCAQLAGPDELESEERCVCPS